MVVGRKPPPAREVIPLWEQLQRGVDSTANNQNTISVVGVDNNKTVDNSNKTVNVTALFVGRKNSGKSTVAERFINPSKDEFPRPSVALDYKFVRHQGDGGGSKSIAHIYDCAQEELADVVIRSCQGSSMVCCVILDGSEPRSMLSSFLQWTAFMRGKISNSSRPDIDKSQELPDRDQLKPYPVPLVVVVAKYDIMLQRLDAEHRKLLLRALRYFSHIICAHFVTVSTTEKTSVSNYRGMLKALLFGTPMPKPSTDLTKSLCIPVGADSIEKIGPPMSGAVSESSTWQRAVEQVIPKKEEQQVNVLQQTNEELKKFPETTIDSMVSQKQDELVQYRRQAARVQRLDAVSSATTRRT